ncbi:hypothetical protein ACQUKI_23830 [Ralstonia pseudosolanacearum]
MDNRTGAFSRQAKQTIVPNALNQMQTVSGQPACSSACASTTRSTGAEPASTAQRWRMTRSAGGGATSLSVVNMVAYVSMKARWNMLRLEENWMNIYGESN